MRTGTRFQRPDSMAVRGCEGTTAPPTTAPFGGAFGAGSRVVTSFVRRHTAAVAGSAHPSPAANAVPAVDTLACVGAVHSAPISITARANRSRAVGDARCVHTDPPPAD